MPVIQRVNSQTVVTTTHGMEVISKKPVTLRVRISSTTLGKVIIGISGIGVTLLRGRTPPKVSNALKPQGWRVIMVALI